MNGKLFPPELWSKRSEQLRPIENYDGQGKSMEEETGDSLKAAGVIFLVTMAILLVVFWLIYLGVTGVGQ